MDATPHLVVGAALGRRLHPVAAFAVGVASNAVLDFIPHTNYTGWQPFTAAMLLDALVGGMLVLVVAAFAPPRLGAVAGALGGAAPEVERIVTGHAKDFLARPPLSFPQNEIGLPWGIVTQAGVTLLALLLALRREPRRSEAGRNARPPVDA